MSRLYDHPYDAIDLDELRKRSSMKWCWYPDDVLPAWVAEMDFPLAEPIRAVLTEMVERGDTGYAWPGELAEAYAEWSRHRFGYAPDPARGAVVQDIMRGVLVALYELTPPGSGIAVLTPAYPPFFDVIEYAGRRVVSVPLTPGQHLDRERLEHTLADPEVTAFVLCNPHNPTGRVFTRDELMSVAEIASRQGVLVLADEVHAPLVYDGNQHIPYASLGPIAEHSVTFVSASKGWNIPGLKCALVFANSARTYGPFGKLPMEIVVGASPLGIAANIAAFRNGQPWLDDTVAYLDGNRWLLAELLADRLPEIRYVPPEATYLAWLDCRELDIEDEPSRAFLSEGRVAVNPGTSFGDGGTGFVRLNFATSRPILTEVVERMADARPVWSS